MAMDNQAENKIINIEEQQKFVVTGRSAVIQKLRQLAKHKSLVTAYFGNGKSAITAVVDIIRDMDLVAMDYGTDEATNQELLNAKRIHFTTQVEGVNAQFSANSIIKAKYQGESVFAIPIPEEMLWMQRREYYRVRVPLGTPAHCRFTDPQGREHRMPVFDISVGGIALLDEHSRFKAEAGQLLEDCELELPEHGTGQVKLEVRNAHPHRSGQQANAQRIGCLFVDLGMSFGATIQRYIHEIETLRKRVED
jgi:c-di-GMP-binding flagellar brake protein YcgR